MAIIYTYPTKTTLATSDLILISDSADANKTKNATVTSIKDAIDVVDSITATSPLVASGSTGAVTLSIPAATSSVNGYLASSDWSTFNSKQVELQSGVNIKTINNNSILGSGDLAISGTGLSIFDEGSGVGLNIDKLDFIGTGVSAVVDGNDNTKVNITVPSSTDTTIDTKDDATSIANPTTSLSFTTGLTAVGAPGGAASISFSGGLNDLSDVSFAATANGSLYVGQISSQLSGTPVGNVTLGGGAAKVATTAFDNTIIGSDAALAITEGSANVAIGSDVAATLTTGTNNVIIGDSANIANATLSSTTVIGQGASGAADSTVIGKGASASTDGTAIGSGASASGGGIALGKNASAAANEIALNGITSSIVSTTGNTAAGELKITINGTVYYIALKTYVP